MFRIRTFLTGVDRGFLIVILLTVVAAWPFLSRPGLPQETDAELHIYRLHELGTLVRAGELYPRWAPDFYHGYGYPIFNYYAPLTYYLGLTVELWPWMDAVDGVKAVFVLGLMLSGLAMYGFVKEYWGRLGAFTAAAAYVYSPYILYIDPHARGVLAESFSFALLPLALWTLSRLASAATARCLLSAVMVTAAIILTHNLMALLFFPLLTAYHAWMTLFANGEGSGPETGSKTGAQSVGLRGKLSAWARSIYSSWSASKIQAGALLLGLGVAAFFWLPVLLERSAVNLDTLVGRGDNFDFRTHFLELRELLAVSPKLDWGDSQPAYSFSLGLPQWVLGLTGIGLLLFRKVKHQAQVTFFALSLLLLIYLMLPASTPLWESVPLLPYFQFPWRLLGPASAMLAILTGAAAEALLPLLPSTRPAAVGQDGRRRAVLPLLAIALVTLPVIFAVPLTQPAPWTDFGEVTTARMSLVEQGGRWLGTTSTSDFVPADVAVIPERNGDLAADILEGREIDRVNRAVSMIPAGATVTGESKTPLRTVYTISSPESFRLRLFQFYFPGWIVKIDGRRAEIEIAEPEGFIVIPVPAGDHVVEVDFGSTPARSVGTAISGLSLIAAIAAALRLNKGRSERLQDVPPYAASAAGSSGFYDKPVAAGALVLTLVILFLVQPSGWLRSESTGYRAEPAEVDLFADFGDQIALIGYDSSATSAGGGEKIKVVLYWQAESPLQINYQVFLHLLAADGTLAAQSDKLNPGDFPTRRWPLDRYVRDVHVLQLPADLPQGDYQVAAGLWVKSEGWRLPLLDESGEQIGDNVPLYTLQVVGQP